jgi:Cu/Ag efflux protein CusF
MPSREFACYVRSIWASHVLPGLVQKVAPKYQNLFEESTMKHLFIATISLLLLSSPIYAADDVVSAVSGTVKKVDAATKTVTVETDDGAKHAFHYTKDLSVHGAKDVAKTPEETLQGVKDGSKVAVHYTAVGGRETAHEVDVIGDDGLKVTKGTVTRIDRGSKLIAVKTEDGSEETFHLTERAAKDSGKDTGRAIDKSAKVTVYYTEDTGKKIAHFFE